MPLAALRYKAQYPDAVLVGLDTQLAREWLSERDDGKLPDLIGIRLNNSDLLPQIIDLIEVKTHADYDINDEGIISGHAVEQAGILEDIVLEMFGKSEKITTISRREILREQVFEGLFNNKAYDTNQKYLVSQTMNNLFAGNYAVNAVRRICHVDFSSSQSEEKQYNDTIGKSYTLTIIGAKEIQELLSDEYIFNQSVPALDKPKAEIAHTHNSESINKNDPSSPDKDVRVKTSRSSDAISRDINQRGSWVLGIRQITRLLGTVWQDRVTEP